MIKVAFQGEAGAYSEDAAIKFFGSSVKTMACESFSGVFDAVGRNAYGIVPIENSLEGSVGHVVDLFMEKNARICGEEIIKVNHCLIAQKNSGMNVIDTVYSHPQALAQCRKFLEKTKFRLVPVYDTAGSVKMIKNSSGKNSAAIASERAAKIYGMKILAKNIQYSGENYTRFLILSEKDAAFTGRDKTSAIFKTENVPGSLHNALGAFAKQKINLTKIESRPVREKGRAWDYMFYVDLEGHISESRMKEAFKELEDHTSFVKILGSYPRCKSAV